MKYIALPIVSLIAALFLFIPVTGLWLFVAYKNPELLRLFLKSDLTTIIARTSGYLSYQLSIKEIINLMLISFGVPFVFFGTFLLKGFKNHDKHASARWATYRDVKKAGFFGKGDLLFGRYGGKLISNSFKKYRDPRTGKTYNSKIYLGGKWLFHPKNAHAFVIGPPSAGKGTSLIIPCLQTWPYSAIVLDIRGETFDATANYRSHFSHIYKFAPLASHSHRYNPLDFVRPDIGMREQDIVEISEALIPIKPGTESYWGGAARQLMNGVISLVLEGQHFWNDRTRNLASCIEVIQGGVDIRTLMPLILETEDGNLSNFTKREIVPFMDMAAAQFSGVYGHLTNALQPYQNSLVQALTETSDFDIRTFKKTCQTLYIDFRLAQIGTITPLANLLISQTTKFLGENILAQNERPVILLLDEFSNLGRLQPILSMFKALGGYGVSVWIFVQSIADLDSAYGRDGRTTLLDSSDLQIFMGAQNPSSLQHFENLLGKKTVQRTSKTTGTTNHVQLSDQIVPLMSQDELRLIPNDDMIILPQNQLPIYAKRNFWFADRELAKRANTPPKKPVIIPDISKFQPQVSPLLKELINESKDLRSQTVTRNTMDNDE